MKTLKRILICFLILLAVTSFMLIAIIYSGDDTLITISYLIWLFTLSSLPIIYNGIK